MENAPLVDITPDNLKTTLDGLAKGRADAWVRRVNAELGAEPSPWRGGTTDQKTEVEKALEELADVEVSDETRRWAEEHKRDEDMRRMLYDGTEEEREQARAHLAKRDDVVRRHNNRER